MRFSFLFLALAGCSSPPLLEGFYSGGIAGAGCPPASHPRGSCSNPDCGVACELDTPCDPAAPACPPGYACDASFDQPYCVPAALCDTAADCASGEYCVWGATNPGICVPVVLADVPCAAQADCAWPFSCAGGACKLWCSDLVESCPSGTSCVDYACTP